ncbi:MAG: hypothetical protein ACRCU6_06695, partial [Fusobacteriaceae bacterium]
METGNPKNQMQNYNVQNHNNEDEIDLYDLIAILAKNKMIIGITTLVIFLGSLVGGYVVNKNAKKATAIIGYTYNGISEGKLPKGSAFNSNIIPVSVATEIYTKYNLIEKGINFNEFLTAITIQGITPTNINTIAENALKRGEIFSFTPSRYSITLKLTGDKNQDLAILKDIIDTYIQHFRDMYTTKNSIAKIELTKNVSVDYFDYSILFNNTLNSLKSNLQLGENSGFKSNRLGLTYADLGFKIDILKTVDINQFNSYIKINNLTKNPDNYVNYYKNQIRELTMEKGKLSKEASSIRKVIDSYKPVDQKIILPNLGEQSGNLQGANQYYSELTEKYLTTLLKIDTVESKIIEYTDDLKNFKKSTPEEAETVNNMIKNIASEINSLVEQINVINTEFEQKELADIVKIVAPAEITGTSKAKLILKVGLVLGLFMGIFMAFVK